MVGAQGDEVFRLYLVAGLKVNIGIDPTAETGDVPGSDLTG
jgi:hypothetical protein